MSHVPTVLKSDRSVFDKMLPVDDNVAPMVLRVGIPKSVCRCILGAKCVPFWGHCDPDLDLRPHSSCPEHISKIN